VREASPRLGAVYDFPNSATARGIWAGYESVATAGLGYNETRKTPIVLQLRPETPYVAVHDAALGHVVRPPQRVEDSRVCQAAKPRPRESAML
jgi:hypothetical protein